MIHPTAADSSATRSALSGRPTAVVVGAGVAGLTAAHVLARTHAVTLIEAEDRVGGHAHTHTVRGTAGQGSELRVDSGFIVHNERTYPTLLRLFAELEIATQPTEMSMSVSCGGCGLEYAGGTGGSGVVAQPARLADPRYVRLLADVPRFHRRARAVLAGESDPSQTWGDFLRDARFPAYTIRHFALPLVACVWSSGHEDALAYPARHLFAFLEHHGMLAIGGSPTWRTVVGGSATYVDELVARLRAAGHTVRAGMPVRAVQRRADAVDVHLASGELVSGDVCVMATHADDTLAMLSDPSDQESASLAAIGYSSNETWLHRDASVLPRRAKARASWNYRLRACDDHADEVLVSYWMNRLMDLPGDDLLVTLNPRGWVREDAALARMTYRHPIFTTDAVAAADRLRDAGGPRLAFAGAHFGWGFHEDGARSGAYAAQRLGAAW